MYAKKEGLPWTVNVTLKHYTELGNFLLPCELSPGVWPHAHWCPQVLRLALAAPAGDLFVSLYESASEDATPAWAALLDTLLAATGTPAHVIWGGAVRRVQDEYRIAYLARVCCIGQYSGFRVVGLRLRQCKAEQQAKGVLRVQVKRITL